MKQKEDSPWEYAVTMEEVPDEEMPNGEIPIDCPINSCIIHGGQLWDKNLKKIEKSVEEIVHKKYYASEYLFVFLKDLERMPLWKM